MWIQWHIFTECTYEYWLSWCVHSVCSHAWRENMVRTVRITVRAWTEQRVILWMELALARRVGRDLIVLRGLVLMDCLGQSACQYVSATLITQTCESCYVIFVLYGRLSAHSHYPTCLPFSLTFRTEEALYHSRSAVFHFSSSILNLFQQDSVEMQIH